MLFVRGQRFECLAPRGGGWALACLQTGAAAQWTLPKAAKSCREGEHHPLANVLSNAPVAGTHTHTFSLSLSLCFFLRWTFLLMMFMFMLVWGPAEDVQRAVRTRGTFIADNCPHSKTV